MVNEGDEACTTNLCQMCFNKHLQAKEEEPLANVKWRQVVEKKAYRGRMWKMIGKEPYLRGMWEHCLQQRSRAKRFRELAEEEKQAGIQGQWQQESQAREYLEHVKCSHDTDCNEPNVGRRNLREKADSLGMGLRQDKRGFRLGSKGRGRKD